MAIKYWVSGGTSWLVTSSWSLSQGGAAGAAVPLPSDSVVFGVSADVSTAGGNVVSMTVNSGVTVNMSGTGATTLTGDLNVNGTLNQTSTSGAMIMSGSTTSRIYMAAGVFHKLTINKSAGTATCRLDSAIFVNVVANTSVLLFSAGVFDFNSQTVTCSTFNSPSGTRTWNQTADMYVTGTGATQVFNVNAGLTTSSNAGTVRISGDAGATVIVIAGTSFTAASAWKISLQNGYNYNCSGNIYDFNCNGVCSVTGTITVYNDITGAGLSSPLVTLNFSNSSGGQTRTFSWAGSWNIVNFTPGTGTGTIYNITYVRATTINCITASQTYNFGNLAWTTGIVTCSGATSTYSFANLTWTTGNLILSGTSSNYYFGTVVTTGLGIIQMTGTGSTYYMNNAGAVANIATVGDITFSNGTIEFGNIGNVILSCRTFTSGSGITRVINWSTTYNSYIQVNGTGGINISNITNLTTNTTDSMAGSTNNCGFKAVMTGGQSVLGAMALASGAFNMYVSGTHNIPSGSVRNLIILDNTTMTAAAAVSIYQTLIGVNVVTQTLTGLVVTMLATSIQTINFPYAISGATFTGAGASWTIAGIIVTTVVFNGSGSTYYVTGTSTITTLTHTNGTLDLTGSALSIVTSYSISNNTNSKAINFGTNNINIAATTGTPWRSDDSNYLTCTGTGKVVVRGGTVTNGGTTRKYTDQPNFYLQENAAAYTLTSPFTCRDLTINNYTPTASFIFYIGGSLAWTFSGSGIPSTVTFTFNSTPAATISTNSTCFSIPTITVNEKTLSAASNVAFTTMTVNSGFDSAGYAMTCGTILTVNSAGVITCGASTWTMLGSGVSTGWNAVAGSTMNAGTSNIIFSGAGEKYAAFGSAQTVNRLTNAGTFTPSTGGNGTTWLNLTSDAKVTTLANTINPSGFKFTATPTVTNMNIAGISGSLTYIQGNVNSNSVYMKNIPYLSLLNSVTASGGAGWYAGPNGVNNGVNTGWKFINSVAISGFGSF